MCTHSHSKGDAADLVDDPVTATISRRTAEIRNIGKW